LQLSHLVGMLEQMAHAHTNQIGGRFMAREEQKVR